MRISPSPSSFQASQRLPPPVQQRAAAKTSAAPPRALDSFTPSPSSTPKASPSPSPAPSQPTSGGSSGEGSGGGFDLIGQIGKMLMQQIMGQVNEEVAKLEKNLKEHLQKIKELER